MFPKEKKGNINYITKFYLIKAQNVILLVIHILVHDDVGEMRSWKPAKDYRNNKTIWDNAKKKIITKVRLRAYLFFFYSIPVLVNVKPFSWWPLVSFNHWTSTWTNQRSFDFRSLVILNFIERHAISPSDHANSKGLVTHQASCSRRAKRLSSLEEQRVLLYHIVRARSTMRHH